MLHVSKNLDRLRSTGICILIFTAIAVLSGCSELPGFKVQAVGTEFDQVGTVAPVVDILFVVDNSGSMGQEQSNLASSFSTFINLLSTKTVDFNVGVLSTDVTTAAEALPTYPNWWSQTGTNAWGNSFAGFYNDEEGSLLSTSATDRFITDDMGSGTYIPLFQSNIQLGVNGNGAETPLLSVQRAVASNKSGAGQWNNAFFRNDAHLAIVIVTDEDESISATNGTKVDTNTSLQTMRMDDTDAAISALKGDLSDVSVHAITSLPSDPCGDAFDEGDTVVAYAERHNGITADICENFGTALSEIATGILTLLTRFELNQPAVEGSISVSVNESSVPESTTNGWEYVVEDEGGPNEAYFIQFNGNSVPEAGASVLINYIPGEPT